MKLTLLITLLLTSISFSYASSLSEKSGDYLLEETLKGFCPTQINITQQSYSGRNKEHGLIIVCGIAEECRFTDNDGSIIWDNVVYEFSQINLPGKRTVTTDMLGFPNGFDTTSESFKNDTLVGHRKASGLFGKLYFESNFVGTFKDGYFDYEVKHVNNMAPRKNPHNKCSYRKI